MKPSLFYLFPYIGLIHSTFALTISPQNVERNIGVVPHPGLVSYTQCPNFGKTNPTTWFGPNLIGSCRAMQWLKCGAILVECGAVCVAATGEEGFNPWADFACQTCVGTAAVNACNRCWKSANGQQTLCNASKIDPDAKCLTPFCKTRIASGNVLFNSPSPPPATSGDTATS